MAIKNIADLLVATMEQAGVKRIFGIVGDSLNGLTEALRSRGTIAWVHVRHEEVAAFAAAGEAQITGDLAVCAGSCGPGKHPRLRPPITLRASRRKRSGNSNSMMKIRATTRRNPEHRIAGSIASELPQRRTILLC